MERHRHSWLRSREKRSGEPVNRKRATIPNFRSDNDLYQWWMWGRVAIPMTLLCYGALRNFNAPLKYAPLSTVPAIFFYVVLKLLAWRDRRAGRRFSQYDTDDISW